VKPKAELTDIERRSLYDEAQDIMRRLPGNMGKIKSEGRATKQQLELLERLDEIEKVFPNTSPEWKKLYDQGRGKYDQELEKWRATNKAESLKKLEGLGLKEGGRVSRFAPSMLGLGGITVEGTVKIGKDGMAYVQSSYQKGRLSLQGWKKIEPPKPTTPTGAEPLRGTVERLELDLERSGSGWIRDPNRPGGRIDYSIQQRDDGTFYYRRVENGVRTEKGQVGPARGIGWSMETARAKAVEDAKASSEPKPTYPEEPKAPMVALEHLRDEVSKRGAGWIEDPEEPGRKIHYTITEIYPGSKNEDEYKWTITRRDVARTPPYYDGLKWDDAVRQIVDDAAKILAAPKAPEEPKTPPAPAPSGETPRFKKGDRVVIGGEWGGIGRHGTITEVHTVTMTPVFGDKSSRRTSHYYTLKSDAGTEYRKNQEELTEEMGEAPKVAPDISVDGYFHEPERVLDMVASAKEQRAKALGAASRARLPGKIGAHNAEARRQGERAARFQAAYDAWAAKYPEAVPKPEPVEKTETPPTAPGGVTPPATGKALVDFGMLAKKTKTKNGKTVWEVSGDTRTHSEAIKSAGGRWYRPKKVWSFYQEDDPTPAILRKIKEVADFENRPAVEPIKLPSQQQQATKTPEQAPKEPAVATPEPEEVTPEALLAEWDKQVGEMEEGEPAELEAAPETGFTARYVPYHGWRENLLKARDYAAHLGIDLGYGETSSKTLEKLVAEIDQIGKTDDE
jgi:hypothetical protein